jgi:hypothetical protein
MAKAVKRAEKALPADNADEATPELPRPPWVTVAGWLAAVFSVVCIIVISVVWVGHQAVPYEDVPDETRVVTQAPVDAFNDANVDTGVDGGELPTYIPTGVMIQSLEFKGPYTLQMAGYLWQLYPRDREDIDQGVVFPEADTTNFSKVYEAEQGDEVLVGWSFKTTLREQFDYGEYPLDRQEIWLRMWSVDFEQNVFLVPDIGAYADTNPTTLPGVEPQVVLENWKIEESYFSYRLATYNADFGIQDYEFTPKPELYFNIDVERYLLGPLFSQGIAPFIILLQLFVIVMVIGRNSKRLDQFGVRPGAVLFTCAAYVFAVLISQNGLRNEVRWPSFVYLEGLHVITYFAILAVAMNSVLLVARPHLGLFKYGNAWARILYWPAITGAMLAITLAVFS